MPLDAYHLHAITQELHDTLNGGRIDKITMPAPSDCLLWIRAGGTNHKLLISTNPAKPRIWLTTLDYVNPAAAPAFCMHLRKYLLGGKILSVSSGPYERVVTLHILAHSEIGDERQLDLVIEIMGRYSNILLVNDRRIISDCLKHTPFGAETARAVLPNLPYRPTEQTDKFNYTDGTQFRQLLADYPGGDLASHLLTKLSGFASFTLRLILRDLSVSVPPTQAQIQAVVDAFDQAYAQLEQRNYRSYVVFKGDLPSEFTILDGADNARQTDNILIAEQTCYSRIDAAALWQAAVQSPTQAINAAIKKITKRIEGLRDKLKECGSADQYRLYGELLTANLYQIKPRSVSFTADNWYDGTQIAIPLDKNKSAVENANLYYKKYNKLKRASVKATELLEQAENELNYLESVRVSIALCDNLQDLEGISEELSVAGLLKRPQIKGKRMPAKQTPLRIEFEGYEILVGKNNFQNEEITFKIASTHDVWLHVLQAHGSHVVIRGQGREIPESVILRAAELAAYYSSARASDKVAVDYCFKKHVLRNSGKGTGNVIYSHQHTLYVHPSNEPHT